MRRRSNRLRVLDFDCEARPLGWYAGDETHKETTVIAWCWWGSKPAAKALSKDDRSRLSMLRSFRRVYDEADMVVGHYIRKFDLPLVNAMLVEVGEPPLSQKLTHDTMLDHLKIHGLSKSQENLCAMYGVEEEKVHMTVADWRRANRLQDVGKSVERAVFDVVQNMALYDYEAAHRLLGPPKVWRPT